MAIKVSGTTVISNNREVSSVNGFKTVGGESILGSGDIAAGGSGLGGSTSGPNSAGSGTSVNISTAGLYYYKGNASNQSFSNVTVNGATVSGQQWSGYTDNNGFSYVSVDVVTSANDGMATTIRRQSGQGAQGFIGWVRISGSTNIGAPGTASIYKVD
jgi:hypothetical protein